jgi:hypothetical protein
MHFQNSTAGGFNPGTHTFALAFPTACINATAIAWMHGSHSNASIREINIFTSTYITLNGFGDAGDSYVMAVGY